MTPGKFWPSVYIFLTALLLLPDAPALVQGLSHAEEVENLL